MKSEVTKIQVSDKTVITLKKGMQEYKQELKAYIQKHGSAKGFKTSMSFSK
jgi:hypothetical protein